MRDLFRGILSYMLIAVFVLMPMWANAQIATPSTTGTLGYKNYVVNPSCVLNGRNITPTGTAAAATRVQGGFATGEDPAACLLNFNAAGDKYRFLVNTLAKNLATGNCEASAVYSGTTMAGVKVYVEQNTGSGFVRVSPELNLTNTADASTPGNIVSSVPCGGTSVTQSAVTFESVSGSLTGYVNTVKFGRNLNIGSVQSAQVVGKISWVHSPNCRWTGTTTAVWASYPADNDCATPTVEGNITAPGTKIPAFTIKSGGPGTYVFRSTITQLPTAAAGLMLSRFSDGTIVSEASAVAQNGTGVTLDFPGPSGSLTFTTAFTNKIIDIQGYGTSNSALPTLGCNFPTGSCAIEVLYFPSQVQTVMNPALPSAPTIQKFLSGSGTYTKPFGVTHIQVKMVGGGGGGAGSGTSGGGSGGNGGSTTFGTGTASGGNGGPSTGFVPAIVGATLGSGWQGTAVSGTAGGSPDSGSGSNSGGGGGNAPYYAGGAPTTGTTNSEAGNAGVPNTGGGGSGGQTVGASYFSGPGGGSGAFIEAFIPSPASTYSYSVGVGGTAGTAGTGGFIGGTGGSGYIEVTEYYGAVNAPILVGGVVSSSTGTIRNEYVSFSGSSDGSACTGTPCNIYRGTPAITSISRTGTGNYSLNFAAGTFSAPPVCVCMQSSAANSMYCQKNGIPTASAYPIQTIINGNPGDHWAEVICMGPRN